jgi:hypothetical protein
VRRIDHHPWALQEATYGVSNDGWISGSSEDPEANGTWAYFGPQRRPGTVTVVVARKGFCAREAPGTNATVRIGPLQLNEQHAPRVARAAKTIRFKLPNCGRREITLRIAPPVAEQVHVSPTIRPSDYGASDNRELGAQVGFKFTPSR